MSCCKKKERSEKRMGTWQVYLIDDEHIYNQLFLSVWLMMIRSKNNIHEREREGKRNERCFSLGFFPFNVNLCIK